MNIVRPNQFVAREIWDTLLLLCISLYILPPILYLSSSKLNIEKIISLVALLGEVEFSVKNDFVGHGIFKGVIINISLPRTNNKIY